MIQITDLSHVTLIIDDISSSKRFYGNVLGMDEVPRPSTFTHAMTWFRKGGAEVHLIHQPDAAQEPGDKEAQPNEEHDLGRARHLAFSVEDLDETVQALADHGVPVVLGPRPRGDGATQMYCRDPDGHLVELHTPPTM